jgi:hypothetical protein
VRKRRNTHLECDAGDAAENFIHLRIFFATVSASPISSAPGSAEGVELSACGGWPAAFLADFRKGVRIAWKEYRSGVFSQVID